MSTINDGGLRDEQTPAGHTGGIEMTDQQRQEFEAVTRPVIEWLNANCHPHVTVVIEPTGAMLSEGIIAYTTNDYLRD